MFSNCMAASLGEESLGDMQKGMHLWCLVLVRARSGREPGQESPGWAARSHHHHLALKSIRWLQTSSGDSPARSLEVAAPYHRGLARTSTGLWGDARETLGVASEMGMVALVTPVAVTSWV